MNRAIIIAPVLLAIFLSGFCSGFPGQNGQTAQHEKVTRTKRNLWQFGLMIHCETNRWASDYLGYGCWCGPGGKGTPIDETDKCCKEHDKCYYDVHRSGKCSYMGAAYTTIYTRKGCSDCDKQQNNACEQAVCECDSVAVKCFAKAKFNDANKRYSQSKCVDQAIAD
ncbi:acidic phospholipase A2 HTe-like [Actinia tenebrosa]|uniref:Phospholipase A2 n=1 Tax=Actinia tenebrosa TaxID=6105 RepID=A0A6P8H9J5_ACTTE|nr:acidic phospholipase A2 HTe-like [Actinia tenebrosa]